MKAKRLQHGRRDCAGGSVKGRRHKTGSYGNRMTVCLCLVFLISLLGTAVQSAAAGLYERGGAGSGQALYGELGTGLEVIPRDTGSESVFDPTLGEDGYSAVLYDNSNGLPTSESNAIAETADGFLWIGSYSGLICYDGNTFYRMDSTTGVASVVSLYVDSKGRLWIGTNDAGVAVREPDGTTTIYRRKDGMPSDCVRAITEDTEGKIFVATTKGVAVFDDEMKITPVSHYAIKGEYIRDICTGSDGYIYGLTQNGQVFAMTDKTILRGYNYASILGIDEIVSIFPDRQNPGYLYLGTEESMVYRVQLLEETKIIDKINVSPLSYIVSMKQIGDRIWLCADNGIGVIDKGDVRFLTGIPMNNSIERVHADYSGNLWFTSSRQGVMKVVPNRFTDVFEQYGIKDWKRVVNSTCCYGKKILLGTDKGMIVLNSDHTVGKLMIDDAVTMSGEKLDAAELSEQLNRIRIRSIICDSRNRLWISTYSDYGLIRYQRGHVMCFTKDDNMPSSRIRAVSECSDGSILVACTGGAVRIMGDSITDVYDKKKGVENEEVLTVSEGFNGNTLLGTDGGGIYVIDKNGEVTHYGTEDGLTSDVVMRIKKDPLREVFWIVTSNSLAFADASHKITTVRNFPYSNNFDLYENSNGEMWILSSNGVYVVQSDVLLKNEEINPVFYSRDNGLPGVSTANSYSGLSPEGDLYIACSTGVAKVNIEKPFESVSNIKISIPYIEGDGKYYYPEADGSFRIPYTVRKITISCYVFNYTLVNPQLSYRLEGFEKEYTTILRSALTPIDYTNLSGGTYHFEMILKDAFGNDSNVFSVKIVKVHAVSEQLWFHLLITALVMGFVAWLVVTYVRVKTAKYAAREQEQKMFIRETVEAFARTIDMKDRYTNGHSTRVAEYTQMLAKELGYHDEALEKYYYIALLHDIGKIGVPASVLNKQGKLTDEEFKIIKSHSARGYKVLKDISVMPELAIGAQAHHERPDGKGYPKGLKGDEIPRVAQIIAVADTFDAMYSDRPYRKRMNFEKAVSIIKEASGTQLTADVVDAFLRLVEKGEFRAADDTGGGTTEDIDNIHKDQNKAAAEAAAKAAKGGTEGPKTEDAATAEGGTAKAEETEEAKKQKAEAEEDGADMETKEAAEASEDSKTEE